VNDSTFADEPKSEEGAAIAAEVAVAGGHGAAGNETLSYAVPSHLVDQLAVGQVVWVPLRKQVVLGVVLALHHDSVSFALRPINALVEPPFRLDQDRLDLARWLARETATNLFAVAAPFFPPGVTARKVEHLRLRLCEQATEDGPALTATQQRLLAFVAEHSGEVDLAAAQSALGSSLTSVADALVRRGLIERVADVRQRPPTAALDRFLRLVPSDLDQTARAPKQRAVVEFLIQRARLAPLDSEGLVPLADVLARTGTDYAIVGALRNKGVVEEVVRPRSIDQTSTPIRRRSSPPPKPRPGERSSVPSPIVIRHRCCSTASPAAVRPRFTCARSPGACGTIARPWSWCRKSR
jgi:primosomal protein N' (replication factor Y)